MSATDPTKEIVESQSLQQSETDADEEKEKERIQDQTELPQQSSKNEEDEAAASHKELSEDDDGFKTPTSPDHRIPVITQCPPPPSKLKRKAAAEARTSATIQQEEVESIFSPIANDQDQEDLQQHKMKKARTESSDD